jgi:hypothetical protein
MACSELGVIALVWIAWSLCHLIASQPFWNKVVSMVPPTVSANMLTLVGMIINIAFTMVVVLNYPRIQSDDVCCHRGAIALSMTGSHVGVLWGGAGHFHLPDPGCH